MIENIFWTTITIISISIEWFVFDFILMRLNNLKKKRLTKNIALILAILIMYIFSFIDVESNLKLFLAIIMSVVYYVFNYKGGLLKSIIVSLIYWMLLVGFDIIGVSIVANVNSIYSMEILLSKNIFRIELIVISKLLLLLLIPILKRLKLENAQIDFIKTEFLYIGIPIKTNTLSIVVIFRYVIIKG